MNKAFAAGFVNGLIKQARVGFEEFYGQQRDLAKKDPPTHKKTIAIGGGTGAALGALAASFADLRPLFHHAFGLPGGYPLKKRLMTAGAGAGVGGLVGIGLAEALRMAVKSDITMAKGIMKDKRPRRKALETYATILGERVSDLE